MCVFFYIIFDQLKVVYIPPILGESANIEMGHSSWAVVQLGAVVDSVAQGRCRRGLVAHRLLLLAAHWRVFWEGCTTGVEADSWVSHEGRDVLRVWCEGATATDASQCLRWEDWSGGWRYAALIEPEKWVEECVHFPLSQRRRRHLADSCAGATILSHSGALFG